MHKTSFRIVTLPTEVAEAARARAREGATDHEVLTADEPGAYPCRHCLRWAEPGERVVLFLYASIAPGRPYSEIGPIFVHESECPSYTQVENYPADFRQHRVVRAYDRSQDIIDAVVVGEREPEELISQLFDNPAVEFLQAR